MNKQSWLAITGLGVLLATSTAQAHLIPICVDAYASGTEVSGAVGATRSHVTFTQASAESTTLSAWQKADGKAAPYWSASSSPLGPCQQANDASSNLQAQPTQVTGGVGLETSLRLAPVAGAVTELLSVDSATQSSGLDSTDETYQSHSPGALDAPVSRRALMAMNTFSQGFGSQGAAFGSAGGHRSRASANTFGPGLVSEAERSNSPAEQLSRIPVSTQNPGPTPQASAPTSLAGANNGNGNSSGSGNSNTDIRPTPGGGKDGHPIVGTVGNNTPATPATQVPEPETLALMLVGLLGIAVTSRRRKPVTTA